ncbi:1738_t:CDS:10, partial [Scutellospora calospora]
MVYNYDWSSTMLGPMDSWDPAIKNVVNLCLNSGFPICLSIGSPHWTEIYNEAWIPVLKTRHPFALGKRLDQVWPEIYDFLLTRFENIKTTGKGQFYDDEFYELQRDGYKEEAYMKYTFSPIFKSDRTVCAIMCMLQETTQKVLNTRRLKILSEFGSQISEIKSLESACRIVTNVLSNSVDIPYTLIYIVDHKSNTAESSVARLIATTFNEDDKERQIPNNLPNSPEIIYLYEDAKKSYDTYVEINRAATTYSFLKCDSWPISLVIKEGKHVKVLLKDDSQAFLVSTKLSLLEGQTLSVVLIYGIYQFRTLDEQYIEFLQLVTEQVNTYLLNGIKLDEEKKRSKMLADLNYQKVMFFQGVSHELKTPLTLMLSPLDDVINVCSQNAPIMPYLQTIRRNSHRLLKLINALLQFSNMEANKFEAHYRETNIVELTQQLSLDFSIMAKKLGLDFNIDISNPDEFNKAVGDKIYLDHDIYETINLLVKGSNALKHTWNGSITIRLYLDNKDNKKMVILEVSDTGVGIPEIALSNIFQRFYRVESQGSRSHEGTGIGLALVKELIKLHGGDIT